MSAFERLLKKGESEVLCFVATHSDPDHIVPHVAAMLNSGGGTVVLGLNEKLEGRGVGDAEPDGLEKSIRSLISPIPLFSITEEVFEGQPIFVIDIPSGRDIPFVADGRVYLRKGIQTVPATGEELRLMFEAKNTEATRWERRISPLFETNDIDEAELHNLTQSTGQHWQPKLQELGMMHQGQLTNAADVCLAKNSATRHPQVRLKAFAFDRDKGSDFVDHQDFTGPICQVLEAAMAFSVNYSLAAARFVAESMQRQEGPRYPEFALREGLVNALAHRDYATVSSGASVMVYPDRLEIWNSGSLPEGWKTDRLTHHHPSLPNNPDVAQYLYLRKYMERVGRGTLKIVESFRDVDLPAPQWKADKTGVTLTFFAFATPESTNWEARVRRLLADLQPGEAIANRIYAEQYANNVSARTARRDLDKLCQADLLRVEGRGKATVYVRTERRWIP